MSKKIVPLFTLFWLGSFSANAFLTPKLLAKFSYGLENRMSQKIGGSLAFELELIKFFSGGILVGYSAATIKNLALQRNEPGQEGYAEEYADVSATLIDIAAYLKPQLPISLGVVTLTLLIFPN